MPGFITSKLAPPTNWEEFESITRDALSIKWDSPELQKNGRTGQAQAGVDVFGDNHKDNFVGVQCKNTGSLTLKVILEEANKAKSFRPEIQKFYMASPLPRDSALQESVRLENEKRKEQGLFKIDVFFWDDIQQEIAKDKKLLNKYYSEYMIPIHSVSPIEGNKKVSLLDLGYYGLHIESNLGICFGPFGCTEREYREFQNMLNILEDGLTLVAPEHNLRRKINLVKQLRDELTAISHGRSTTWEHAVGYCRSLEDEIRNLQTWLNPEEVKIFKIGIQIGSWDIHDSYNQNSYSSKKLDKLLDRVNEIMHGDILLEISEFINKFNKGEEIGDIIHAPFRVFNSLRNYYLVN